MVNFTQKMSKEQRKKSLIEELGVHFETTYDFPPLAARIYSSLVLTEEEGLTFEECLTKRGASKSSISTSLNLLLKMGLIAYFTKSGDRKRYFKLADKNTFFIDKLSENLKKIENEGTIIAKVGAFNKEFNTKKHKDNTPMTDLFLKYLEESKRLLIKTIEEFKNLNN